VLAAVVAAVVVGGFALANLRGDEGDKTADPNRIDVIAPGGDLSDAPPTRAGELTGAPVEPSPTPTPTGATAPPAGGGVGPRVVYEVLVAKPAKSTTLTYHDKDGDRISYKEHPLPWKLEFTATSTDYDPSVTAQVAGGNGQSITCRLTVDGKLLKEHTDSGRLYPTVIC
jgi:hypothetical protein